MAIIWFIVGSVLAYPVNQSDNDEIAFEDVVCKMASILSRPQWVDRGNRWVQIDAIDQLKHTRKKLYFEVWFHILKTLMLDNRQQNAP